MTAFFIMIFTVRDTNKS